MYAFSKSVCITFLNANNVVYMVRAFKTREQQSKVTAYGAFFSMLAGFLFNMLFPVAMSRLVTDGASMRRLILLMGIPLTAVGLIRILTIKEQYNNDADTGAASKLSIKEAAVVFSTNKNAVVVAVALLLVNIATSLGVSAYYWKYVIGNTELMGIASAATFLGLPLAFCLPALRRKMGQKKMCLAGFYVQIAGCIVFLLAGKNILLVCVATIFFTVGVVPFTQMLNMMVVDCADFNEMNGRTRMEGTLGSVFGLTRKIGAALGAFVTGLLLGLVNYDATLPMGIDNPAAVTMIRMLVSVVPMVLLVLCVLVLMQYHLDDLLKPWRESKAAETAKADAKPNP